MPERGVTTRTSDRTPTRRTPSISGRIRRECLESCDTLGSIGRGRTRHEESQATERGKTLAKSTTTTAARLWMRHTARCAVHGCRTPHQPDPHHVRAIGMGGTRHPEEADRENMVPLCRMHHAEGHAIGWRTWARKYELDLGALAVEWWTRWESQPAHLRAHYSSMARAA